MTVAAAIQYHDDEDKMNPAVAAPGPAARRGPRPGTVREARVLAVQVASESSSSLSPAAVVTGLIGLVYPSNSSSESDSQAAAQADSPAGAERVGPVEPEPPAVLSESG